MRICGFQKTTLLDYPEHVAATVFVSGCNFRCPFCHNGDLVRDAGDLQAFEETEILGYLKKRAGVLDGVCITGGEPTLQPDLKDFIVKIRDLGLEIKLDTNGYRPEVLRTLLQEHLLSYVAMDIKASKAHYPEVSGAHGLTIDKIEESVRLLMEGDIPYEFRTTVVKGLHEPEEFEEIGKWLAGARAYYLQNYRDNENVLVPGYASFSKQELEDMAQAAGRYISRVELRGVE